jgi:hypothetical protein
MLYAMLRDREVTVTNDLNEWVEACDIKNRRVARTTLSSGTEISTDFFKTMVFEADELLGGFESMAFGGVFNRRCCRYDTWEQAEAGHAEFCAEIEKLEADLKNAAEEGAQ